MVSYRWGWWRSPCPAGAGGSDGSPCHERPRPRSSYRPGTRGQTSSYPENRNLGKIKVECSGQMSHYIPAGSIFANANATQKGLY